MNWKTSALLAGLAPVMFASTAAAATCESLRNLTLTNVSISSAEVVAPPAPQTGEGRGGRAGGPAAAPILPEHCRVKMVLKPTTDSNINVELWMPTTTWNGKFMAVGNGGFGGSIQGLGEMQTALRLGYSTAGSDTGHSEADGPNGMFALGHPEKIVDFAHRAVHEMTATSKHLVDEFYGKAAQFSYFKGCSTGGRQAVMAAQRYPEDFDGIIAGALANRHIHMHTAGVARSIELSRHPEAEISPAKAQMVSTAVMNACDTLKEGFLNNPKACSFDFAKLACSGADADTCLTQPQLKTVEAFYGGLKNSKGEVIFAGQVLGNPLPPQRGPTTTPGGGYDTVRIWGFQNADYNWRAFDLDRDMPVIDAKVGFVDAVDPDLSKFKAHGGKLLLYAGWGDTTITPKNTVEYYESVLKKMGKSQDGFTKLYLVPGMAHCRGGDGPNTFDTIGTMEAWREKGVAPTSITAFNPQSGMTRPLCAYPQYAKYQGTGNLNDAANWACTAP